MSDARSFTEDDAKRIWNTQIIQEQEREHPYATLIHGWKYPTFKNDITDVEIKKKQLMTNNQFILYQYTNQDKTAPNYSIVPFAFTEQGARMATIRLFGELAQNANMYMYVLKVIPDPSGGMSLTTSTNSSKAMDLLRAFYEAKTDTDKTKICGSHTSMILFNDDRIFIPCAETQRAVLVLQGVREYGQQDWMFVNPSVVFDIQWLQSDPSISSGYNLAHFPIKVDDSFTPSMTNLATLRNQHFVKIDQQQRILAAVQKGFLIPQLTESDWITNYADAKRKSDVWITQVLQQPSHHPISTFTASSTSSSGGGVSISTSVPALATVSFPYGLASTSSWDVSSSVASQQQPQIGVIAYNNLVNDTFSSFSKFPLWMVRYGGIQRYPGLVLYNSTLFPYVGTQRPPDVVANKTPHVLLFPEKRVPVYGRVDAKPIAYVQQKLNDQVWIPVFDSPIIAISDLPTFPGAKTTSVSMFSFQPTSIPITEESRKVKPATDISMTLTPTVDPTIQEFRFPFTSSSSIPSSSSNSMLQLFVSSRNSDLWKSTWGPNPRSK